MFYCTFSPCYFSLSIHSNIVNYSIPNVAANKQLPTYQAISLSVLLTEHVQVHLKDFYLTLLSSMHYGDQRKPSLERFLLTLLSSMHYGEQRKSSLERFLPHIIAFNALW